MKFSQVHNGKKSQRCNLHSVSKWFIQFCFVLLFFPMRYNRNNQLISLNKRPSAAVWNITKIRHPAKLAGVSKRAYLKFSFFPFLLPSLHLTSFPLSLFLCFFLSWWKKCWISNANCHSFRKFRACYVSPYILSIFCSQLAKSWLTTLVYHMVCNVGLRPRPDFSLLPQATHRMSSAKPEPAYTLCKEAKLQIKCLKVLGITKRYRKCLSAYL